MANLAAQLVRLAPTHSKYRYTNLFYPKLMLSHAAQMDATNQLALHLRQTMLIKTKKARN